MGIGTGTAALIGTVASTGAGLAGSAISASNAGKAADTQAAAANHAADLQYQASQDALNFQKQQYNTSQQQMAPWLQAGQGGVNALQYGLGTGGTANGTGVGQGSLMTPYSGTFNAPTGLTEQNDPGYQARMKHGTHALQRSSAARGSLLTGGTAKALDQFGQDYASNEYGNVYNRALTDYTTQYNAYNTNQANQYNRLAAMSGVGQTTANQLANMGQAASNNVSSNLLNTAQNIGQQYNNAGAATASGYVGAGNAWNQGLSGVGSNVSNLAMLSMLKNSGGSGLNYVPTAGMNIYNNL